MNLSFEIQDLRRRINGLISSATTVESGSIVKGPNSVIDERIAVYDGTTGKLIKDGGKTITEMMASSGDILLAEKYDISAIGGILLCSKYSI